jgi:hypothetical protein
MKGDQRQIVAFMTFAVLFGLVGHTIKVKNNQNTGAGADVKILLGGALGTVLLVLLSEAGSGGDQFAKGLAVITLVSSVLVNGTGVFGGISKLTAKTAPTPQLVTTPKAG